MKLYTIIAAVFIFNSMAFAETYVCQIDNSDQTLLLKKLEELPVRSDENIDQRGRYNLQIQTTELAFPSVNLNGIGTTADVQFYFKSDDKSISVSMYLDDAEGTLYKDGPLFQGSCRAS